MDISYNPKTQYVKIPEKNQYRKCLKVNMVHSAVFLLAFLRALKG